MLSARMHELEVAFGRFVQREIDAGSLSEESPNFEPEPELQDEDDQVRAIMPVLERKAV